MSRAAVALPAMRAHGLRQRYLGDESDTNSTQFGFDIESLRPGFAITDTTAPTTSSPDIQWIPSYETFLRRVERLETERKSRGLERPTVLPKGFPAVVEGSRVWTGQGLQGTGRQEYIVHLGETELQEIQKALGFFLAHFPKGRPDEVTRETFRLPTLKKRLERVSDILHSGMGFLILRGLDPAAYTQKQNVLIYVGICRYIGPRFGIQDADGSYLIHIKDVGKQIPNSDFRQAPYTNMAQPFHCDSCDILAMYTVGKAQQGGASYLASTGQIYNEIARSRPDIIGTLAADDWIMDKQRTERGRPSYWYKRPILFNFPQHGPGLYFNRRVITGSPVSLRSPGVPPMSEEQAEALDMVHFTAEQHQLKVTLEPGDVLFVNNFAVPHARESYLDGGESSEDNGATSTTAAAAAARHMMRLWLRDDGRAWETPRELAASWIDTYGRSPRRAKAKWDVEVPLKRERVLARANSCS